MTKIKSQITVKYLTEDQRREWGKKAEKQARRVARKEKYASQGREN